jgi:hypothetical protein
MEGEMNTFRALLLDFEREPDLGNQLREIFAASAGRGLRSSFNLSRKRISGPSLKRFPTGLQLSPSV